MGRPIRPVNSEGDPDPDAGHQANAVGFRHHDPSYGCVNPIKDKEEREGRFA